MQSTDLSVQVFAIYQLINKKNKKKKTIYTCFLFAVLSSAEREFRVAEMRM